MNPNVTQDAPLDRVVSWAAFTLLAASAAAFAWYVPQNREAMLRIYADFELRLPRSTELVCAVPSFAIVGLGVVSVVGAFVIQVVSRSKRSASLFHLLLTFVLGVLFLVYREAMGNALVTLFEGISGQRGSR